MSPEQIVTSGAGVIALVIVFRIANAFLDGIKEMIAANTLATNQLSKTMEAVIASLTAHDMRAAEIEAKMESATEQMDKRLDDACATHTILRDKIVQIETHLSRASR